MYADTVFILQPPWYRWRLPSGSPGQRWNRCSLWGANCFWSQKWVDLFYFDSKRWIVHQTDAVVNGCIQRAYSHFRRKCLVTADSHSTVITAVWCRKHVLEGTGAVKNLTECSDTTPVPGCDLLWNWCGFFISSGGPFCIKSGAFDDQRPVALLAWMNTFPTQVVVSSSAGVGMNEQGPFLFCFLW